MGTQDREGLKPLVSSKGPELEPEPISDGDMVFDRDSATVDRMARSAQEYLPWFGSGSGKSLGFRIRHLFDNLKR